MNDNIQGYFNFALEIVKECGKIMKEATGIVVKTKKDDTDLVTQYDNELETKLIQGIKSQFPEHKFISEEDCFAKNEVIRLTDDPTWIIDPIDGTSNFIRKLPFTCISVGFTINKIETIGIIYNPFLDELYTAIKGKGAFLNGVQIHTNGVEEIRKSVFTSELSLAVSEEYREVYLYRIKHLISAVQGFRSIGCAAISLCYVACGRIEAYNVDGLYPWDAAAGAVIVREAGGYMCQANGAEFDVLISSVLATGTKALADQYSAIIRKADEERLNNEKKNTKIQA